MSTRPAGSVTEAHVLSRFESMLAFSCLLALVTAVGYWLLRSEAHLAKIASETELSSQRRLSTRYYPTPAQWATLTVEPVQQQSFRSEFSTEGKIAVDEDLSTPIFSAYSGRVIRLMAKPGDRVERGHPLLVIEATDTVQTLNDFVAAITAMNKARSALNLAKISENRSTDLYAGKAVPLKDVQAAQAGLVAAENDMRSAETALDAARSRLRILGRAEDEITAFEKTGQLSSDTPVYAPIGGTIVQRKVGPGQYVSAGSSDPVFIIGDLSKVWLTAYVRETEALRVKVGQTLNFTLLAFPDRVFEAKFDYVAATLDPNTRRLLVRATIDNKNGLLKAEMFANVTIFIDDGGVSAAIARDAIIYKGNAAGVWVVREDQGIELRQIKLGLPAGKMVQVTEGLNPDDRVITKGSLFIDRAAAGT